MKYDDLQITNSESYPTENIIRQTRKKRKIDLLDIFIVQSIVCVAVSCGVLLFRMIGLNV